MLWWGLGSAGVSVVGGTLHVAWTTGRYPSFELAHYGMKAGCPLVFAVLRIRNCIDCTCFWHFV